MNNESCNGNTTQRKNSGSLAERLRQAMLPPLEEEIYLAAIRQALWSIDQFAALMGGLTPENYKNGTKGSTQITDDQFIKREAYATKVFSQFLDYMEETSAVRDFVISDEHMFMSSWKFIKWIAENNIPMKKRFYTTLPLALKELYIEFQPISTALRTQPHYSRAYHEALYLQHAEELLEEFPSLTPKEIYQNPRMENVLRSLRSKNGHYKKRTILESWLPKLMKRERGRPKKPSKPSNI